MHNNFSMSAMYCTNTCMFPPDYRVTLLESKAVVASSGISCIIIQHLLMVIFAGGQESIESINIIKYLKHLKNALVMFKKWFIRNISKKKSKNSYQS